MALDKFGFAVRDIRIEENILLYDMAKALRISPAALSGMECGRLPVPDWFIPRLLETYPSAKAFLPALDMGIKERRNEANVNNDTKRNSEGYSDPTVHAALSRISKEEQELQHLKKVLSDICALSGYRLKGQVTLVEKKTGFVHRF